MDLFGNFGSLFGGLFGQGQGAPDGVMGDMAGSGVGPASRKAGLPDSMQEPGRWDKFLKTVEGNMETPMSPGGQQLINSYSSPSGIMDASRPQYGMEDFRNMFSGTEQGERERIINVGLMSPYVDQLLGGKYV